MEQATIQKIEGFANDILDSYYTGLGVRNGVHDPGAWPCSFSPLDLA